jgi:hypothetical protein
LAENPSFSFVDSIGEARERLATELRAQAEQIEKISLELNELQSVHDRIELEAARQWDAVAIAAESLKPPVSAENVLEDVLGAVRGLMTCTIPEQVIQILTEEASQWGVRAAIFDVRGRSAWGASAHGFGPAVTENSVRSLIVQLSPDSPFRQVCESAGDVEATAEAFKKNRNVLEKFKPASNAPILLLPIRSAGTVTAIFYADPGEGGETLPVSALKILAEFAGAQIDRLIALSGGFAEPAGEETVVEPEERETATEETPAKIAAQETAPLQSRAEEHPADLVNTEAPAVENVAVEERAAEALVAEAHSEVSVVESPEPRVGTEEASTTTEAASTEVSAQLKRTPEEPVHPSPEISPEYVLPHESTEVRPVATAPEASPESPDVVLRVAEDEVTPSAQKHIGTIVEASNGDAAPSPMIVEESHEPVAPAIPAAFEVEHLTEAEQKVHKDARRFAKLLVSEIELYNRAKVADGRKNQDLYKRLKSDIDRSRLTFEKRFGKNLSRQVDYFHDELVKNLAADDSAVLGPEYPGPSA